MVTPNSNICLLMDKDSNPYVLPLWLNACYSSCYVVVSHVTEMHLFVSIIFDDVWNRQKYSKLKVLALYYYKMKYLQF